MEFTHSLVYIIVYYKMHHLYRNQADSFLGLNFVSRKKKGLNLVSVLGIAFWHACDDIVLGVASCLTAELIFSSE